MARPSLFANASSRRVWGGMMLATLVLFGGVLLPPLLSPTGQSVVMHAFAPVCHQIPIRSPHLGDVQLAVCDRCIGIYLGLVLGVMTIGGVYRIWEWVGPRARYLCLGSLVPLGIDWAGPVIGLWSNVPTSRALTGLGFGLVVSSFVAHRLLRRVLRPTEAPEKGFDYEHS